MEQQCERHLAGRLAAEAAPAQRQGLKPGFLRVGQVARRESALGADQADLFLLRTDPDLREPAEVS